MAFAALLCCAVTGCIDDITGGEYTYTLEVPTKVEETESGITTTTEYTWNTDGSIAGQKQIRGGQLVYDDHDYTYGEKEMTYYRTYYEAGVVSGVVRVEEKFISANWTGRYSIKFYREEPTGDVLVEREESIYTDNIQSEYVHEMDKVMLLHHTDYEYNYDSVSYTASGSTIGTPVRVTITYLSYEYGMIDEIVTTAPGSPQTIISRKKYVYPPYGQAQGYKVFKGDNEQVIEEQTDYAFDGDKLSYTTKWYDDAGTVTRTLATVRTTKALVITVTTK
jgi:hypothetical protein